MVEQTLPMAQEASRPVRGAHGRFLPGHGMGRPLGSRQRLATSFLNAMRKDFDKHGVAAIQRAREEDPVAYMRTIASLLPKELDLSSADGSVPLLRVEFVRPGE